MAKDPYSGLEIERGNRKPDEAGYKARQTVAPDASPALVEQLKQRRQAALSRGTAPDGLHSAEERERRANAAAVEARRKISAIMEEDGPSQAPKTFQMKRKPSGGLSLDDLSEGLTARDLNVGLGLEGLSAEDKIALGFDDMAERASAKLFEQSHYGDPDEATMLSEQFGSTAKPTSGSWKVTKAVATLKNGSDIPVWFVQDSVTKMKIEEPFRMQEVAQKTAAVLNKSGNVNDPALRVILEAYRKHIDLMKQIRAVRKMISEGQIDKKGKLQALQAQLEVCNGRLGL